ncbi:MAG: hypothetical protein ACOX1K_05555 [Defluviitoga tunisiensis]
MDTRTIVDDPDDDSKWGQNNDVNWLGVAADEQVSIHRCAV